MSNTIAACRFSTILEVSLTFGETPLAAPCGVGLTEHLSVTFVSAQCPSMPSDLTIIQMYFQKRPRVSCHLHRNAMLKRASDWTYTSSQVLTYAPICAPDLRTFCPRVFGINRHFSQESALQTVKFRAPDWTYARATYALTCAHTTAYAHKCAAYELTSAYIRSYLRS